MKNPLKGLGGSLKKLTEPKVKLKFSTCGEIMIDGLPFSFGVESDGISSDKGLVVSISGEAVDSGKLTFEKIELNLLSGAKVKSAERKRFRRSKMPAARPHTGGTGSGQVFGRALFQHHQRENHHKTQHNSIPAEGGEIVLLDVIHQELDRRD